VNVPGEPGELTQRVRLSARALSDLVEPASAVGPELVEAIRATTDEIERRLGSDELVVVLAGESGAIRALLNSVVGARAFDPAGTDAEATITVRAAQGYNYRASLKDGTVVEFALRMPNREDSFARAQARAERERESTAQIERDLRTRVEEAEREATSLRQSAEPAKPARAKLRVLARFWQWLRSLASIRIVGRRRGESAGTGLERQLAALKNSLSEARVRARQAAARREALCTERPKYEQERAEAFVEEVRAFTDGKGTGPGLLSIEVWCPTPHLREDVALVSGRQLFSQSDGVLLVPTGAAPGRDEPARIAEAAKPARVRLVRKLAEMGPALALIRAERPAVVGARADAALRRCIARVAEEGSRAEAFCRKRIAALEAQRIPDPARFRARQLARVARAIDDGARDVETSMLARWHANVERTRTEWRVGVEACANRSAMQAFVHAINRTARDRLQSMVDEVGEYAIAELQRVSETMQIWLLEEIHARYQVARRIEEGDEPTTVLGDAIDVAPLARAPLQSAVDKFELRRVRLGLGGAAAGAVLGSLLVPGLGTAIGAFLGVFAGWLRRLDSLRDECAARLEACLDEVERTIAARIAESGASFATAVRASLDEALDDALARLEASIARLMALERRVLETERERHASLARLRAALEEHTGRM
jgi:hypothetical protein